MTTSQPGFPARHHPHRDASLSVKGSGNVIQFPVPGFEFEYTAVLPIQRRSDSVDWAPLLLIEFIAVTRNTVAF